LTVAGEIAISGSLLDVQAAGQSTVSLSRIDCGQRIQCIVRRRSRDGNRQILH
jgi:hypothetical protein